MNALVSGRSGRAVILDGESLQSLDVDDPYKIVPRHPSELPYLFGEGKDLLILENTTIESVAKALESESNFTQALDVTLISLDSELPDDIRMEALEELEQLLADGFITERVENVLYSAPLPVEADLTRAKALCDAKLKLVQEFFQKLENYQSAIARGVEAWEAIPVDKFTTFDNKKHFRQVTVKEGLCRALATLESPAAISNFILKAGLNSNIQQLPNYRQILQEWTKPFRPIPKARAAVIGGYDDDNSLDQRVRKRGRIDRKAVLRETVKKKSVIIEAMHRRDLARVEDLVDELVEYQRDKSEPQHVAKSLCDLAMEAKTLGMYSVQLALTQRSISVAPGDKWSWAQHADGLLRMGRLDDALKAYKQAEDFGAGVVAKTGRAEVLKAQGKLSDALTVFAETIQQHPDNIVARTGRAEVLKTQGHLNAALGAFDEVIARYPDNTVAKNGRAEVLKAQGLFADALTAYSETVRQFPENTVAKNGRADVLKAQGRFADALTAYDETIRQHPDNTVARNGRAEVLKAQGRFADALSAYSETIRQHPDDVFATIGRAEVLKAQGQFDAALEAFDEAIEQHPYDAVARNGRSCVLFALGRHDEALKSLPTTPPVDEQDWIAYHIRGMCLLRFGEMEEALRIFNIGLKSCPFASQVEYFRSALALWWLWGRDFQKAGETLDTVTSPLLQPSTNVIRIHAFGAQYNRERAVRAYESLEATPHLFNDDLTQELGSRYVLGKKPTKSDEWVFDREVRLTVAYR